MVTITEVMSKDRLDNYIKVAAKTTDYEDGFGIRDCDLNKNHWWAVYTRQSTREQAENDRLVDYLATCAKLAKEIDAIVPEEYVIYDANSSEDFNRPGISYLRGELIAGRRIAGVIIPQQGRLSAIVLHQLAFERECRHYEVQVKYGDSPSGDDWASETTRMIQAQANWLRVQSNRNNALGGNIARVLSGKVPSGKAPYGYKYRRKADIDQRGRTKVQEAWWEVGELESDDKFMWGSPAWVVCQIFIWLGREGRTQYWVAARLNELRKDNLTLFKPLYGDSWVPKMVGDIAFRECYTGRAAYNKNKRVSNPAKPLGDITLGVKRTLLRPKPDADRVYFSVPALTTKELWERANATLRERGRGRGKQGKIIQALLRARIMCPRCGKPMAVKRKRDNHIYYHCRSHYSKWLADPCRYNKFIPGTWDDDIWREVCVLLKDDSWIEKQLTTEFDKGRDIDKLIQLKIRKSDKLQNKIDNVEDGFDGGLYTLEKAKLKQQKYQEEIDKVQVEIKRLEARKNDQGLSPECVQSLRQELERLRDQNILEASFENKLEAMAMLGIKVYPSEDLQSRRINCQLNLGEMKNEGEQTGSTKVVYGRPYRSRTCDTLIKT